MWLSLFRLALEVLSYIQRKLTEEELKQLGRDETVKETLARIKVANEIKNEIDSLGAGDVDEWLSNYIRRDK